MFLIFSEHTLLRRCSGERSWNLSRPFLQSQPQNLHISTTTCFFFSFSCFWAWACWGQGSNLGSERNRRTQRDTGSAPDPELCRHSSGFVWKCIWVQFPSFFWDVSWRGSGGAPLFSVWSWTDVTVFPPSLREMNDPHEARIRFTVLKQAPDPELITSRSLNFGLSLSQKKEKKKTQSPF